MSRLWGILWLLLIENTCSLRIAFWTGYDGNWSGKDADKEGVYGSQIALVNIAELLAKTHDVEIFITQEVDFQLRGVRWRHQNTIGSDGKFDVMVAWRYLSYFIEKDTRRIANRTFVWVHDVTPHYYYNGESLPSTGIPLSANIDPAIDGWIAVSRVHKQKLVDEYKFDREKIAVIPNGISSEDLEAVNQVDESERVPNSFVYASGPDRALPVILDMFPEITKILPNATLSIYYRPLDDPEMIEKVESQPNVHEVGHLSHVELMRVFRKTDYWFYPAYFWETCCTTAMETALAGSIQITSSTSALSENVKGLVIPGTPGTRSFQEEVLATLERLDKDPSEKAALRDRERKWAVQQTWEERAKLWMELLDSQAYTPSPLSDEDERWKSAPGLRETHGDRDNPIVLDQTNHYNHPWFDDDGEEDYHDEL